MFKSQVSSKGQIVIPKPLRDRWGIEEGATLSFTEDAQGLHLKVQREMTRTDILQSLQAGLGLAAYGGPARSPADMRASIKAAFQRKKF
jgi:AbrB family looped-hinge helix DNA binding protein